LAEVKYSDIVEKQLKAYIKVPAVLVTKENIPYEFKEGKVNNGKLRSRRFVDQIPLNLYYFIVSYNINLVALQEFASGLFLNYIEKERIYS
jgi:hypothetical protein